jgi:hypothetical protein
LCAAVSNLTTESRRRGGWKPGQSGNPKGRPRPLVDIAALAREHGPRCIKVIADMLDDPDSRVRVSAATVLLDRGFGRPNQNVTATGDGTLTLHLLAAQTIGRELLDGKVIDGHISPDTQGDGVETKGAVLDQTLPTE